MLAIEPFRDGRTYHWLVADVLQHLSIDIRGDFGRNARVCPHCDLAIPDIDEHWCNEIGDYLEEDFAENFDTLPLASLDLLWETILDQKRGDEHYPDVRDSVEIRGFMRPLTVVLDDDGTVFGDGHHRLAAAIELGMRCIPVMAGTQVRQLVSADSGEWYFDDPILGVPSRYAA